MLNFLGLAEKGKDFLGRKCRAGWQITQSVEAEILAKRGRDT